MSKQITTVSIFKRDSLSGKSWQFIAVAEAWVRLRKVAGQQFFKVMGKGLDGFNPTPDWSTYMHVQVWENEKVAQEYFDSSKFHNRLKEKADDYQLIFMRNVKARGQWARKNPFEESTELDDGNPLVFVLTRARIKLTFLKRFWDYVPQSQRDIVENEHVLFKAGVGEWPVTHMATMSLWDSADAINKFAYRNKAHKNAIRQTNALQWYAEELFSRFQPYASTGTMDQLNIESHLKKLVTADLTKG
ncbi:DUF3291 domain-containing protein [Nonlabens ponticola]|uniref:DUF3291 domain-containing protein n=1 Tax=Nonlabens ponticola TaxID=2496866 RepID=UPI0019CFB70A|nr:DUF3291 domain-containing protein [Nonlabens ponticola]